MSPRLTSDEGFDQFWASYPRKVGKLAAKREWNRLRPGPELQQQIAAALAWQVPIWERMDPMFTPHPRTWLHQGRWMDEPTVRPARQRSVWECPHLEPCSHRAMCAHKLNMPHKYPVKSEVAS